MKPWLRQLQDELRDRQGRHMRRRLRAVDRCARTVRPEGEGAGAGRINLAGNDYLGLASHPRLAEAAAEAARRWGVGAGASRLVSGHLRIHEEVERRFARFKHAGAGLLLPTGYMANHAVLTALAAEGDALLLDKLNHASLIDAARASGATVRVYPHGNLDKLRRLLERHAEARRRFIVTDSIFSMDGDCADLPALCDLRDQYDAIMHVDEAHGTGVLGLTGAGLAERQGVADRVDITVSTASKALGSLGGLVTADPLVIETLINHARSLIYTTAVPPPQAAAIDAALDVVRDEPERRDRLHELTARFRSALRDRGWSVADDPTPIVPLIVGDAADALDLAARLEDRGFLCPAIRPPTVPPGSARVRISLRADLMDEDLTRLIETIGPAPAGHRTNASE
jgi:8-amino-7-oxononanoate synthase